jgi:flavin reductase (DIM6/NTAB) family NADH-FMN oxidoreductase RutF
VNGAGLFTIPDSGFTIVMPAPPVELFRRLTNGVYVVTATHDGVSDGFTAAWITQVAFEPLSVAISINPGNATWRLVHASGRFVVNVLKSGQLEVARHFGTTSGREMNKLASVPTTVSVTGGLILSEAAAWLECRVEQEVAAGDHVVVIARVEGGNVVDPGAIPLRYSETGNMDGSAALYPAGWQRAAGAESA